MSTPTPTPKKDQDSGNHVRQDGDPSASDALFAKWVKDPQENGDYVLNLTPEETRKFFEEVNAVLAEAVRERDALRAGTGAFTSSPQGAAVTPTEIPESFKRGMEELARCEDTPMFGDDTVESLDTQLAEEQAHADRLAQQLETERAENMKLQYGAVQCDFELFCVQQKRRLEIALQAHALRRKPPA